MEQTISQQQMEIEDLRQRLAASNAEIERLTLEHKTAYKLVDYWQKKCAATQAHEARLREDLQK